jgi:predicted transcriptional regulator
MMENLNKLISELGISKVRLAKYLGVSRQMVYNYLELESINKWPKEKKILLLKLLNIEDGEENTIENIKVTTDYLLSVEERLNEGVKETQDIDFLDLKGLKKEEHQLVADMTMAIKEKLVDSDNHEENFYALQYIYQIIQSMDNIEEFKYAFAYMSKYAGFTGVNVFKFNEEKQFMFEGIIHSGVSLYTSGTPNKQNVIKARDRFVQFIEEKTEEKLSRTQQLNTVKIQALRELGYSELTTENAAEVFEKMGEIQSRKS